MLDSGRIGKSFHHVWGMKDTIVCVMETAIPQLPDVTLIKSIATHTHTHTNTHTLWDCTNSLASLDCGESQTRLALS